MTTKPTIQHITPEEIVDYFAALLSETREGEIEEHLAVCDTCTTLARDVHTVSQAVASWTARSHGEAYQRMLLATAVQQVQDQVQDPRVRERLRRWQASWAGTAQAAVRLVLDTPDRAARLITEGLEALVGPGGQWEFALATGLRTRGAAVRTRGGAARTRGTPRTRGEETPDPHRPQAWIQVTGPAQDVEIDVAHLALDQTPPLVMLVPTQEGMVPRVTELERQQGSRQLLARFASVGPGEYIVAVEPGEQARL